MEDAADLEQADDPVQVDRRRALKAAFGGAAAVAVLTGPGIKSFTVAPAYGQVGSGACDPVDVSFPTGWTTATAGGTFATGGTLGYVASPAPPYDVLGPMHLVEANPSAAGATVTYTRTGVTLEAGFTYTFTFDYAIRNISGTHNRSQILTFQYSSGGAFTSVPVVTAPLGTSYFTTGTGSATITPTTTTNYTIRFLHSFGTGTGLIGNDIAVESPMVSCLAAVAPAAPAGGKDTGGRTR